jgi:hypothetical protein
MKKLLLFTFLLTLATGLFGQGYRMLRASSQYYFKVENDMQGRIVGLKNDSTALAAMDSLFYPYRTLVMNDTATTQCNMIPDYPIWAGAKIKAGPAGNFTWFNMNGDTIHFESAAGFNSPFTVYRYSTGVKLVADLTNMDTMTVAGVPDSVKVFTMQAMDQSGNSVANWWNSKTIILSKNNGVVRMPSIRSFPSDTMMMLRTPAKLLRFSDLYPWQPNDELHETISSTSYHPSYPSYSSLLNFKVLSRTQVNTDSVSFVLAKNEHYRSSGAWPYPPMDTITSDTITFGVGRWNALIHSAMPEQVIDSTHFYDLYRNQCGKLVMQDHFVNSVSIYTPGCVTKNTFEPIIRDTFYVEGVAGYYTHESPHYNNNYRNTNYDYLYYSINGSSCGTPQYVGISNIEQEKMKVWPNPASNVISWCGADARGYTITIYDVAGKEIESHEKGACGTLSIAHLPPGFYPVTFRSDKQTYRQFLVIQR